MGIQFGDHLRQIRLARRVPVTQAAMAAGVSRRAWTAWEAGSALPRETEANAAFAALSVSRPEALEAFTLIPTPWAARLQRSESASRLDLPVSAPHVGVLLAAMRRRAGFTQEYLAAAMNVRPSTIHRWERGVHVPPGERLHELLAALGALPEERPAFSSGVLAPSSGENTPRSLDELDEETMTLCNEACHGVHFLLDLRFLALEAELWPLASRISYARWMLAQVFTWHGMWLCWRGREAEAGAYADSALQLLQREFRGQAEFGRPLHVSIRSSLHHGTSKLGAIRTLEEWLPEITTPAHRAWMLRDKAGLLGDAGYHEAAWRTSETAFSLALTLPDPYEVRCARADRSEVYFKAGRLRESLDALPETVDLTGGVPAQSVREFQLKAELCLALGDSVAAQESVSGAYSVIEKYSLGHHRAAIDGLANRL